MLSCKVNEGVSMRFLRPVVAVAFLALFAGPSSADDWGDDDQDKDLGGMDITKWCTDQKDGPSRYEDGEWRCKTKAADLDAVCKFQYGEKAHSQQLPGDPPVWHCFGSSED